MRGPVIIDPSRACRFCKCTERNACATPTGRCFWIAPDICSAPACVHKFYASMAPRERAELDRKMYGNGFMWVHPDGREEHIPADQLLIFPTNKA